MQLFECEEVADITIATFLGKTFGAHDGLTPVQDNQIRDALKALGDQAKGDVILVLSGARVSGNPATHVLLLFKKIYSRGRKCVLVSADPMLTDLWELLKLTRVIPLVPTIGDALRTLVPPDAVVDDRQP